MINSFSVETNTPEEILATDDKLMINASIYQKALFGDVEDSSRSFLFMPSGIFHSGNYRLYLQTLSKHYEDSK